MARVLDTATVRVELDSRRSEHDAARSGEKAGREYTRGAEREGKRNPPRIPVDPVTAEFERKLKAEVTRIAQSVNARIPLTASGERFRQSVGARLREIEGSVRAKIPADPVLAAGFRRELALKVAAESRRVRARVNVGVDVDRNRITQTLSSVFGLLGRFGERASSVASTAVKPLTSVLGSMNLSLSGVAIAIAAATVLAPPLAAALSIVGGAAVGAFGAITAAGAGLPVLLTSLVAPIAAIALGMDGIKRAAEPVKDEFKTLRDLINVTFELNMRPVFEKLQAIFPTLNVGLSETARAVSRVAMDLTDVVTSEAGIENLRVAFAGVSDTIDKLRPGLRSLFTAMLNIAGTRELYDILGETIGGVAERFAGMLERMRISGDLTAGLEQLRDVMFSLTDALAGMAENALKFAVKAGPGLTAFIDSLTRVFARVDWGSLGEAFGRVMERLGAAIERVPPETWRKLADAVGKLTERFLQWAEGGGIEAFIRGISVAASIISFFAGNMLKVISVSGGFIDMLSGIGGAAKSAGSSIGSAFSGASGAVSESLDGVVATVAEKLPMIPESVDFNLGELPEKARGWFDQAGAAISESVAGTLESVDTSFADFDARFTEFFSTLPDRIGYIMGYMSVTVAQHAQDAVLGVSEWLSQLPDRAAIFGAEMLLRLQTIFTEIPPMMGALAMAAVMAAMEWLSQLPTRAGIFAAEMLLRMQRIIGELPGRLKLLAVQSVMSLVDTFSELPAKMGAWAKKTVEDILRFFRGLVGKLLQAGRDAIQGFIDGVKQKAQSVVDAAKSVVSGAIRGAKDALIERSPSHVFRDIGRNTIQGYILGLRERLAPLLAQIRAIFAQASAAARISIPDGGLIGIADGAPPSSPFPGGTPPGAGSPGGQTVDVATLTDAIAAVLNAADWRIDGSDLTLSVNRGNLQLGRR